MSRKLELKGQNAKRLSPKQKKKAQDTLDRMQKIRQLDSDNLRELIKQKLNWAQQERLRGLEQIKKIDTQVERLNGIILFIQDLIIPVKEENK